METRRKGDHRVPSETHLRPLQEEGFSGDEVGWVVIEIAGRGRQGAAAEVISRTVSITGTHYGAGRHNIRISHSVRCVQKKAIL